MWNGDSVISIMKDVNRSRDYEKGSGVRRCDRQGGISQPWEDCRAWRGKRGHCEEWGSGTEGAVFD